MFSESQSQEKAESLEQQPVTEPSVVETPESQQEKLEKSIESIADQSAEVQQEVDALGGLEQVAQEMSQMNQAEMARKIGPKKMSGLKKLALGFGVAAMAIIMLSNSVHAEGTPIETGSDMEMVYKQSKNQDLTAYTNADGSQTLVDQNGQFAGVSYKTADGGHRAVYMGSGSHFSGYVANGGGVVAQ